MKIKNLDLLRRRVNSNIREDQLVISRYAQYYQGADTKMHAQVCGIGCLGLPHTTKDRLAFMREHPIEAEAEALLGNLQTEFGISSDLARLLEAIFVAHRKRGVKPAERFLRLFVRHLPEGVSIGRRNVAAFCARAGLVAYNNEFADFEEGQEISWPPPEEAVKLTRELVAWLDAGARVSKMPELSH